MEKSEDKRPGSLSFLGCPPWLTFSWLFRSNTTPTRNVTREANEKGHFSQLPPQLRGQSLHCPTWTPIFDHWSSACNPYYEQLIPVVDKLLERMVEDERKLMKLKKTDFALFISRWWPRADWRTLQKVTSYTLWMFLFDDTIDAEITPGVDNHASNFAMAQDFRSKVLNYIRHELGLAGPDEPKPVSPDISCELFGDISDFLLEEMAPANVLDFWEGLKIFIESNAPEQEQRLSGKIATTEEFYTWRLGTTAVDSMCALGYALSGASRLPADLSEEDRIMRLETNKNTIYVNDILSLKKEIEDDTLVNLVVITMSDTGDSLNSAVARLTREMREGGQRFDQAAASIRKKAKKHGPIVERDVEKAIEAYELIMTSVWTWTEESPRYGLHKFKQPDGSFTIPL